MTLRPLLQCAALLLAGCIGLGPAAAQSPAYPDRPVKLVVPYAPGGPTDLLARSMAVVLSRQLGQPVVVDNRAGAGGVVGTGQVVAAPADGYTLLLGLQGPITINPALTKVSYDPFRDLVPVRMIATAPMVLMASRKSGITSLASVKAASVTTPGGLNIGSAGNGTLPHVAAEMLRHEIGANLVHVPYKGAGPALADLAAGNVDLLFSDLQAALSFVQSGQVVPLAVTGAERSARLPKVPTMGEGGGGNARLSGWYGVFAPRNLPPAVLQRLDQALDGMFKDAAFLQLLDNQGAQPSTLDRNAFQAFLQAEHAQWAQLGKVISIKMD